MKLTSRIALAIALLAPAIAGAQGTMVFSLTGQMPDTVKKMAQGMGPEAIDLRMTMAYDGDRIAMQIEAGPEMTIPGATFDLSTVRINIIFSKKTDSMQIGIVMPPEITAMLGGGLGYRFDLKIPDSLPFPAINTDSMMAVADTVTLPKGVNTGRTSNVAGMTCEEWEFVRPVTDTVGPERISMCLVPMLPLFKQFSDDMANLPMMKGLDLDKLKNRSREMFGGRDLIPIRMTMMDGTEGFKFELVSLSNSAPDASFFTLPADLQPFPMEMFGGAPGQ